MRKPLIMLLALLIGNFVSLARADSADGWKSLFDGTNLDQWENPYEWGEVSVVDGEIRLKADKKFFLLSTETYSDFIFEGQIKLPEGKANSGFLFRCHQKPNKAWGYQAEVDPSERSWSGGLYDEGRRKWLHPVKPIESDYNKKHWTEERRNAFKRGEWNSYKIQCEGPRLRIWVNGILTTDFNDDLDASGYIGLQHHGEAGQVYSFRNLRIKKL